MFHISLPRCFSKTPAAVLSCEVKGYISSGILSLFAVLQEQLCHDCKYTRSKEGRIPKIIHQIWNEDIVPTEFVENIKSFIKYNGYPEWEYYFWTQDVGREFIKQKFPKVLKIYDGSGEWYSLHYESKITTQ